MIPTAHREFLESHRLAVVAVQGDTRLSLTPVYYIVDRDDLLVSTQATRFKARAVRRQPDVVMCVLGEEFPFPYLTVYGTARIEEEGAAELMARIGEKMIGSPIEPDTLKERAAQEQRVVLRVSPQSFSPAR